MAQLDRTALRTAPAHAGLEAKLAALAAFVAEHLSTFDPAYGEAGRVATYLDQAVVSAESRRERVALMGSPARYAEVVPADRLMEDAARPLRGAMGEAFAVRHAVDVVVYYGLPPRQSGPGEADTRAFRRLVEGPGDDHALPGLRVALAAQAYLTCPAVVDGRPSPVAGAEMPVDGVRLVAMRPAWLSDSGGRPECRHEALLTLTIDG